MKGLVNDVTSTEAGRPRHLFSLALAGTLGGAAAGIVTNSINGLVSPEYFFKVMGWYGTANVWRASVEQGAIEGMVVGAVFSIIFACVVASLPKGTCTFGRAGRWMLAIAAAALACWVVGGLVAMTLSALRPEFYSRAFIGVPTGRADMLRYAWVGGSIMGIEVGGGLCLVVMLLAFRASCCSKLRTGRHSP